jgi:SAM-dependent methyltransferase
MSDDKGHAEPPYARRLSRLVRHFPNFDFFFIKPVRRKAVDWLQLRQGDRVLDLGCGGGGSLPHLVHAVGAKGFVLGVDISPQSCMNARRRIEANGWDNVEIVEAAAHEVHLSGTYECSPHPTYSLRKRPWRTSFRICVTMPGSCFSAQSFQTGRWERS